MNGILLIDKPSGLTSRDVVNIVGKSLGTKKIGHTGTLDPLATGVMVLCVGKYTKLVEMLTSYNKTYEASIVLGIKTDTLDITGKVLEEKCSNISLSDILLSLKKFEGVYDQEVPIYSAVKINGKKLYEYARENKTIELPKRSVNISKISLISDIKYENNKTLFSIRCNVSKGTYIRSLINDIASSLNTIGVMKELRRIEQGNFNIENCYKISDIKNNNFKFVDLDTVFKDYFIVDINSNLYKDIKNGKILENIYNKDIIVFRYNGEYISIYKKYEKDKKLIKPWKMLL